MKKATQSGRFIGLRVKILIPILIICIVITFGAVCLAFNSCLWIFENTLTTRIVACYDAISDHKLEVSDFYMSPKITDNEIFNCDWFQNDELMDMLERVGCSVGSYRYEPENNRFILIGTPDKETDCLPILEGDYAKQLRKNGSLSFLDISENGIGNYWIFTLEDTSDGNPKPRAIGTGLNARETANNLFGFFALVAIIMYTAAIIIFVVICVVITRAIRRIRKVSSYLETVTGESLPDKPLRIQAHDEITRMSSIVNRMVDGLRDRNRMEAELNVAAELQKNMLPDLLPENARFILDASMCPAKEVAGDFYDFFMIDDRHLALLIADVSGKGMPAALFMTIGKKLLRDALKSGMSPKDAATSVNKSLSDENILSHFITAWIGILDLDTSILTYTNAGHNPPYVLCDTLLTLSKIHGTPLAVFEHTYDESTLELHPGNTLFLFTDGITEAFNSKGEMYSSKRLVSELNSFKPDGKETLIAHINRSVSEFRGSADQSDDITMLSLTLLEQNNGGTRS